MFDTTPFRPTLVGFVALATLVLACAIIQLGDAGGVDMALTAYFVLLATCAKAAASGGPSLVRVNLLSFVSVATVIACIALFALDVDHADAALSGYNMLMAVCVQQATGSGGDD